MRKSSTIRLRVWLKASGSTTRRGKPPGTIGAEVWLALTPTGQPAPPLSSPRAQSDGPGQSGSESYKFLSVSSGGNLQTDFPSSEAGKTAYYAVRWVSTRGGIPNKVQVGDMGIDGRIFPVGTKPAEAAAKGKKGQTDHMFAEDWFPIQVKQMDKVGRPDIDAFEAVMHREDRQRGFFVAFGFSSDAERECAAFHKKSGRIIKLITVQVILDEHHVQKM